MNIGTLAASLHLDSRAFMTGLATATKGTDKMQGALEFLTSAAGKTALAIGGVTLAATLMAKAIAKSTEVGAKFEHEMRKVQAVSRATEEQYKAMSTAALDASKVTMWTATQSASAMKYLAMAGFSAEQAMAALPSVLQLATAGMLDVASASDIATNIMSGFGMTVDELERANNVIVATATSSNTSVEELGEAMKYAAPVAKALGYSIEDVSGMMSILANAGVKGSMAGTNMAQSLLKAEKAAQAFGMEGGNVLGVIRKMKEEGASVVDYQKTFGLIPLKSVLIMRDNLDAIHLQTLRIKKANMEGVAAKTAETMEKGVLPAWERIKSAGEGLGSKVFETFSDELASALDTIAEAINDVEPHVTRFAGILVEFTKAFGSPLDALIPDIPDDVMEKIDKIGWVATLGGGFFWRGGKAIQDQIAAKDEDRMASTLGADAVFNDSLKKDERWKHYKKTKEEYEELLDLYREGSPDAGDPGEWKDYWEKRDPSKNITSATTDAVSKQIMDLLEKHQALEQSAKDFDKAIKEGWTSTYERKIGMINDELETLSGKQDTLSEARRAALQSERDELNSQNDYAAFLELDAARREDQLFGLEGPERKRKEAELELNGVKENTAATEAQKAMAEERYRLAIKQIGAEEKQLDLEKKKADQKEAQLLLDEQTSRLNESSSAVDQSKRQVELAGIKNDLDKQLKQNEWERIDAITQYNALLKEKKITQTQFNKLSADALAIERDKNTITIGNNADRQESLFKAKMSGIKGRIQSVNDQSALSGTKSEYERDLLQNTQQYRDLLADINAMEIGAEQREQLLAEAQAWKQVADAAALASEEKRQAAENMEFVSGTIQTMAGAVEGPLTDAFESFVTGTIPDLGDIAGAMLKEVQLKIARLTAELTARGLFHSIMSFVDQGNTAFHAQAAAQAYAGAATMGTIAAGSYLGSQFHAGITDIPENLDNVSLVKGERVVDAQTNQDLKTFLAENNNAPSQAISVAVTQQFPAGTNYAEIAKHADFIKEQAKIGIMEGIANVEPIADSIASVSSR